MSIGTVCVVIEHWNNMERWPEDFAHEDKILAIAGNPSIAEQIVAKRKAELLELAATYSGGIEEGTDTIGYFDGVEIHWPEHENWSGTFNFGFEQYEWEIKDFEIKEES